MCRYRTGGGRRELPVVDLDECRWRATAVAATVRRWPGGNRGEQSGRRATVERPEKGGGPHR